MFTSHPVFPVFPVFDPRSTDTVLPLSLCQQVVMNPENVTSHVMPPRSMSESSPVSVSDASVSVMPLRSVSDSSLLDVTSAASVSVMPPRSLSDPSLLNVTSDVNVNVNVNALHHSVSDPFPVSSPSTNVTGLVDDPVTTRSAALSRSLGMFLAGHRTSIARTKARQRLRRSLEALHSFRAAKNSGRHAFWEKAPKEVLQRPVVNARPEAIVMPEATVPRKKLIWPDVPEHEHIQVDGSLKCCLACLAALEGRTALPNAEASTEAARQEEKDPQQVACELGVKAEFQNFVLTLAKLFIVVFGYEFAHEARRRFWTTLTMSKGDPSEAGKAEARVIMQIIRGSSSLLEVEFPHGSFYLLDLFGPDIGRRLIDDPSVLNLATAAEVLLGADEVECPDRNSYLENLFGPDTARRLEFVGDPLIESMVTVAEALLGTDAVDVEDSEDESEAQQFTLHEYDSDVLEESLGQFSQMYYHTFRQEMGPDDETQESPRRGPLTVRNPDSEDSGDQQFTLHEYDPDVPEESLGQFSQMYHHTFRQEVDSDDESEDATEERNSLGEEF
ncbi:hypothetical protein GRF29_69g1333633 [Pseudopithomyces chartarum]|uniref:Uncharacterized protein n=1 Tax=Pseudopithomyces chartarum TaxID=1892770 RepID=A0AAN6M053_9PLEO|nr:hypothetical protein GRF29_69g1333633 [Pseudopithomyces chartarum]